MYTHNLKGLKLPVREKATRDNGWSRKIVAWETFDVTVVLDLDAIAQQLGEKAASSKSRKATIMSHKVVARAVKTNREEV